MLIFLLPRGMYQAQVRYSNTRLVMPAEMFNCGMAVSSREQLRCIQRRDPPAER